jgi:hypothetical protein
MILKDRRVINNLYYPRLERGLESLSGLLYGLILEKHGFLV